MRNELPVTLQDALTQLWVIEPYFAEVLTKCSFMEDNTQPTAAVGLRKQGVLFIFNLKFILSLNTKQLIYLMIHEVAHIMGRHAERLRLFKQNAELSNVAADMIINSSIEKIEYLRRFIEPPTKDRFLVPKEYHGEWIVEDLYKWLMQSNNMRPYEDSKGAIDQQVFLEEGMSQEEAEAIVEQLRSTLSNQKPELIETIEKIIKVVKNPLEELFRYVKPGSGKKNKTYTRPSLIGTAKGYKRVMNDIVVILDTSGSMQDEFKKVLSYLLLKQTQITLIQCDTEVQSVGVIKNPNEVKKVSIKGLGGTVLQPAIDLVMAKYRAHPLVILTDGYFGEIDLRGKHQVAVASTHSFDRIIGKHKKIVLT